MNRLDPFELFKAGSTALQGQRYAEALTHLRAAEALAPEAPPIKLALALALAHTEGPAAAVRILEPLAGGPSPNSDARHIQREFLKVCPTPQFEYWSLNRILTADEYLRDNPEAGAATEILIGGGPRPLSTLRYYRLKNIYVLGEAAMLVTPDERILRESTPDTNVDACVKEVETRGVRLGRQPVRCGEYIVLHSIWSEGFFHWMLEQIPKVLLAERLGFRGHYVIRPGGSFIRQSLTLLGISADRIIEYDGSDWRAEWLWVLDALPGWTWRQHPGLVDIFRKAFLTAAGSAPEAPSRLYISRKNPNRPRRVVNEAALEEVLRRYGIVTVDMETLSLAEQIRAVSNATVLVGPHGAGLIHALFMRPQSLLVELVAPTYINPNGLLPSQLLGHRFYIAPSYLNEGTYAFGQDIEAFTALVDQILHQELTPGTERLT